MENEKPNRVIKKKKKISFINCFTVEMVAIFFFFFLDKISHFGSVLVAFSLFFFFFLFGITSNQGLVLIAIKPYRGEQRKSFYSFPLVKPFHLIKFPLSSRFNAPFDFSNKSAVIIILVIIAIAI